MVATVGEDGRLQTVRGDRESPLTDGFACIRGLQAVEGMYQDGRILRPLKRQPDGSFEEIALETALDEIAAKLGGILDESGGESVAVFKGTQVWKNVTGHLMLNAFLGAIGSTRLFTTITIDQSCKQVTMRRMGYWNAGKPRLQDCDVMMLFGGNPLVSVAVTNFTYDPVKRLKTALKRGMKLIAIDPRRTETAANAHLHLQCRPGEDVTIAAGMIRMILAEGWHDAAFCERHVLDLDRLRAAVAPFTPEHVAARAGIDPEQLRAATEMFARDSHKGIAVCGTGPSMSPRSNLADHMVECLNVICGRFYREGDRIPNPGVQNKRRDYVAQVVAPFREWETSAKTGSGHGALFGELMSGVLADEILRDDPGRIRAMFVNGANPAVALPDQNKAIRALKSLDLLVAVEPFMTATAKLCDYILPPRLMFERADTVPTPHYEPLIDAPFAQYVPPAVEPPAGSEVVDDWYPYWAICSRLGIPFPFMGEALDLTRAPSTDDLLALVLKESQVPFEEIKRHPGGKLFDVPPAIVQPPVSDDTPRFDVIPDDVAEELAEVAAEFGPVDPPGPFTHLLTVRRLRGIMNSLGIIQEELRRRHPYNDANLHPDDMAALALEDGAHVEIASDAGAIVAIATADATVRPGTLSMSHCWGGLPEENLPFEAMGVSTNLLVRTDRFVEKINAMPRFSSIPVSIRRIAA
jgi:anaerobic selenocysteine-containing dehydrogenase